MNLVRLVIFTAVLCMPLGAILAAEASGDQGNCATNGSQSTPPVTGNFQPFLIPLGGISAAIIAGIFSYLALIISKEQKISEFRQKWVDDLRGEVSDLIANAISHRNGQKAFEAGTFETSTPIKYREVVGDSADKCAVAYNRILLRLNPKNESSRELLGAVEQFGSLGKDASSDQFKEGMLKLRVACRTVLKEEWERVKAGEPVFTLSKRLFLVFVVVAVLGFAWLVFHALQIPPL